MTDFLPIQDEEIDWYAREFNAGTVIGIMARQLQSLRSKPVAGVEVKPLEWVKAGPVFWKAVTYYGTYGVERQTDKLRHTFWCWFKPGGCSSAETVSGYSSSLEMAKSDAQAKHDSLALSTLSLPAQEPVGYISEKTLVYLRSGDVNGAASIEPVSTHSANIPLYALHPNQESGE